MVLKASADNGYASDHDEELEGVGEEDWESPASSFASIYSIDESDDEVKEIDPALLVSCDYKNDATLPLAGW